MDLKALMNGSDGRWTEERHSLFLNWIEASFVRRMHRVYPAVGRGAVPFRCTDTNGSLRLDRYVPDSATESTKDSRKRAPAAPPVVHSETQCDWISTGKKTRKRPLALLDESVDQVVPEFENCEDGEGGSASVKKKKHGGGGYIEE